MFRYKERLQFKKYLPPSGGIFFLFSLPVLLLLYSFFWFYGEFETLNQLEEQVRRLSKKQLLFKQRAENEERALTELKSVDHFFIDKHLETLVFLQPEIEHLETSASPHPWLATLRGEKNRLRFVEEKRRSQGTLQETEERQQYPVHMNEEDLLMTLNLIEGPPLEGRPRLAIKDFLLAKKLTPTQERVFEVSLHLIKQEWNE